MAFDSTNLTVIARGGGRTIYSYDGGADTLATMDTVDYFVGGIGFINKGDIIFADGNTNSEFGILVINFNDGTNIDCANVTNLASADTD